MRRHGASAEDVEAVVAFLEANDLHVTEADAGRRRVVADGKVAAINEAFGIILNLYRAPKREFAAPFPELRKRDDERASIRDHEHRGYEGPVFLPAELIDIIVAVVGLDNRQLGAPAATGTGDPPNSNYLSPEVVAQLYNFPNTGAVGQTVGIFEDAAAGAAYRHSDITSFINSLQPSYRTQPVLNDIGVTVGATTYSNVPALVTTSPTGAVGECCIDVSIVAAVVQGGTINTYFTENSEAGWEAFLSRAILPPPGDSPPSVLTASWLLSFGDDAGQIGNPSTPGSIANVLSGLLQAAATRGITVFMAIGDWGSANQVLDGNCHVSYPNCDPWTTACGGTILGNVSAAPTRFQEFVWSDANVVASPFQFPPYVATGGGVSDNFPTPSYQTAAGVLPISKNDGNPRRGVPDVAGMIAMNGFFFAGAGGPGQYGFIGTSLVAPLYAGLVAVIAKWLGRDVGFINPLLYAEGPAICNDVRFGDNESGNPPPDAPVYLAGPGWDACTGWGSIEGFRLLAATAPAPIIVTAIADSGAFGEVCVGRHADLLLTINNTGFSLLLISDIISSSPDFLAPSVASYPLAIEPGGALDLVVRYQPVGLGSHAGTLAILSNDLLGPHIVAMSGSAPAPRLVALVADNGEFARTCRGAFSDEPLVLNNSGPCPLSITSIVSSSADFLTPEVVSYPIVVGPGGSLAVPIRFRPESLGPKSATLSISSNDPASPKLINLSGDAPAGKIAVTGSGCFGRIEACHTVERTISICNTGDCKLHVSKVAFRHRNEHWTLMNNPFPADIHPGSCLGVVVRYYAAEEYPKSCDLLIHSDDPDTPLVMIPLMAVTLWPRCERCGTSKRCCCDKCGCGEDPCACEDHDADDMRQ